MPYFLAPIAGWLASGCLKYLINFVRYGIDADHHMGNGGFPSTHTSTVSAAVFLIGITEGIYSPVFGLAVTFLVIVIIDATGLRIEVGKQAGVLNNLTDGTIHFERLRERMGHSIFEILGGLAVGFITSIFLFYIFTWLGWF